MIPQHFEDPDWDTAFELLGRQGNGQDISGPLREAVRRKAELEFEKVLVSRKPLSFRVMEGARAWAGRALAGVSVAVDAAMSRKKTLKPAPGRPLLTFAAAVFRQKTCQTVFEAVADMRREYFDLLKEGRTKKAKWILVLHYWGILNALTLGQLSGVFEGILGRVLGKL